MATLYEINQEILSCIDAETGEIIDFERLQALQIEREEKLENVALWYKNLVSDAAQYKAEKDAFAEKERKATEKAERLKQFLNETLAGNKYKSTRVTIYFTKRDSVIVDDVYKIPENYVRYEAPTADKIAIKAAIKAGEQIAGVHIENKQSICIK